MEWRPAEWRGHRRTGRDQDGLPVAALANWRIGADWGGARLDAVAVDVPAMIGMGPPIAALASAGSASADDPVGGGR